MMMLSDMADEEMLHEEPVPAQAQMKTKSLMNSKSLPVNDDLDNQPENIVNNDESISQDLLEEAMPMMFSMDSIMEDESINEVNEEMESLEFS
jgi:hypothetical protein